VRPHGPRPQQFGVAGVQRHWASNSVRESPQEVAVLDWPCDRPHELRSIPSHARRAAGGHLRDAATALGRDERARVRGMSGRCGDRRNETADDHSDKRELDDDSWRNTPTEQVHFPCLSRFERTRQSRLSKRTTSTERPPFKGGARCPEPRPGVERGSRKSGDVAMLAPCVKPVKEADGAASAAPWLSGSGLSEARTQRWVVAQRRQGQDSAVRTQRRRDFGWWLSGWVTSASRRTRAHRYRRVVQGGTAPTPLWQ
jgi:hypothetical protein